MWTSKEIWLVNIEEVELFKVACTLNSYSVAGSFILLFILWAGLKIRLLEVLVGQTAGIAHIQLYTTWMFSANKLGKRKVEAFNV